MIIFLLYEKTHTFELNFHEIIFLFVINFVLVSLWEVSPLQNPPYLIFWGVVIFKLLECPQNFNESTENPLF